MDPGDFPMGSPTNTTAAVTLYFERSWSIISTIGIANVLFGFVIVGITSLTPVVIVPIVTSFACAFANGLCFYAYYTQHPILNRAVASLFADVFWLIQEAGLSFYSYVILKRVLRDKQRIIFLSAFWFIIAALVAIRAAIMAMRMRSILEAESNFQRIVTNLHVAFFVLIAVIECLSAFFLLRKFATARSTSMQAALQTGLFQYLMQSTEVRVAMLSLTGITRAITYSFQSTAQSATTTSSQVDRFAYTLESLFPVILYIDILASKLRYTTQSSLGSWHSSQLHSPYRQTAQITPGSQQASSGSRTSDYQATLAKPRATMAETDGRTQQPQSRERIAEEGESSTATTDMAQLQEVETAEAMGLNKGVGGEASRSSRGGSSGS